MVSQTSQVKQQSSTLLQQQSMLLSPLTDSIRLSHFCAHWTLIQDLLSFESIHFMQLFVFLKSFSFYHSITMHHFISSSWRNVTSSLPNVQISTDTNVQCIELSQNDPAECHAAGAWYPDTQRRCSSRIFAQHCGNPTIGLSHGIPSVQCSVAFCRIFVWQMAWTHFLIETPFIVHRHIAGHATRVSHPKNMRSEVIQNSFKFKVCNLIFFLCKRFRKSDFQNVEFWNLKKDQHASTHVRDTYVTGTCGGLNFSMPTPIHTHSDISAETFKFLLQALVSIDVICARFKICV